MNIVPTIPTRISQRSTTNGQRHNKPIVKTTSIIVACYVVFGLIKPSHQQSSISLNNAQWFVSNSNGSLVVPAQVPGGIYSDLRRANILKQEILYGKNDIAYRWVGHENWTYTTSFAIDQQIAMSQSVGLVLHGVDTVATIFLNGEEIGTTDNMFVRYKFDVKPYLKLAGLKNILVVKFESPIKYSLRKFQQSLRQNRGKITPPYCAAPAQRGECHVNFIRKMQASFSWDWGPAFPSMGIYKNIELEYGSFGMIRDILVETRRLSPLVALSRQPMVAPQVIISSNIKHNVRTPLVNKTVPYVRAPPYYVPFGRENEFQPNTNQFLDPPQRIELITESNQLLEEKWLLKITLVAEMVQPSFGYNVRIEFNLNGVLHYESEHINVVANSGGFIRLGFNLRIDTSRMRVKPWWPNNAGSQTLYKLTARMMPIPSPSEQMPHHKLATSSSSSPIDLMDSDPTRLAHLQARAKPLQTPAVPPMIFLATPADMSTQLIQQVSEKEIQFGFRTVELIQEPVTRGNLDDGLTFNFRVNGVDLFAMGSNWIPASVLPENHLDIEYIRYLLQSAKDANMNMLRVWGGGLYESDEFYRLADEMGIMIWHDFMFACALYPVDEDYISSIRLEIEQQIQRLQHHPSIVLWAGNNENEMAIAGPWWIEVGVWSKKLRENYHKLYVETIKPIAQILDPTRPYVVSSPSNGLISDTQPDSISRKPNDNKYGDVHHYDYLTDSFDWTVYPSTRFASEYGFQSYPSFNALTSVTTQVDWKFPLTSNVLHRQHRLTGETEIKLQMKVHFNELKTGGADKLKTFIYVSQLAQAIAIKTETEFYRRNRFIDPETKLGRTMGALYWQLNDVWQAPTWSSIEYGGKWKMLHYFARRFFFPIQVIPYVIQTSMSSSVSNTMSQAFSSPTSQFSGLNLQQQQLSQPSINQDPLVQQAQNQQPQPVSSGPLFVVDLVRDDLFDLLDSFNVTIRFFRWTRFEPVWQDKVYVRNTRPQNVTRIYEQDLTRIVRQPGVISLSSGVFQIIIEQQARLGLSQIENYLMPVAPNRVTAMRVAKINVELIQGPFELTDIATRLSSVGADRLSAAAQWSCAYRITLVSDSIAMFVWLDLNFLNAGGENTSDNQSNQSASSQQQQHQSTDRRPAASSSLPQNNIQLDALPQHGPPIYPPEHIRLHMNNHHRDQVAGSDIEAQPGLEMYEALASESIGSSLLASAAAAVGAEAAASDFLLAKATDKTDPDHATAKSQTVAKDRAREQIDQSETNSGAPVTVIRSQDDNKKLSVAQTSSVSHEHETIPAVASRLRRQAGDGPSDQARAPERLILNVDNRNNNAGIANSNTINYNNRPQASEHQHYATNKQQRLKPNQPGQAQFKPVDAAGSQMLRYQFSDNAFNMFEPSKVIDLYLSRCLSKAQIEIALEIQSLADCL